MKPFITCKQAVDYMSKKEESKISSWQRFELWKHLAICSLCRNFHAQTRLMVDIFKRSVDQPGETLSETDKDAIRNQFKDP